MKTLKKVLAIALALAMVFSFAVTAFAADATNKITIYNDNAGHTYEAYQIFAGDLADGKLSNIVWGSGVDTSKLNDGKLTIGSESLTATEWAEKLSATPSTISAADFADAVAAVLKSTPTAQTSDQKSNLGESGDKKGYEVTVNDPGYYLVKDKDGSVSGQDAYTKFILQVVGDAEVNAKSDYPDVEKDVLDKNDSNSADPTNDWGKSADYDIGDDVEFKLTGTIPDTTGYKKYYYAFHDVMQDTFGPAKDFKVTVGGITLDSEYYEIVSDPEDDDCTFEVVIKDLIAAVNSVKDKPGYNANDGVVVTYTAELLENAVIYNPGQTNEVELEFSNNPNWTGKGKGDKDDDDDNPDEPDEPTGRTPKKKVVVFTYDVTVNKTDDAKNPVEGAQFKLEKFVESEDGQDDYNGKKGTWIEVDRVTVTGNKFEFKGLDDGSYRLTETEAPAGYNKLTDPIYFEITAQHSASGTTLTETEDFKIVNSSLSTDVVNHAGATLPETGGIGTTIFYVVGGLIVAAAVVLLIAKRRMKNA